MPILLPLASILTLALSYETLKGTKKVIDKRIRRKRKENGD